MAENSNIWLKPKPTHIDENFEDFLNYLKTASDKDSDLYHESIKLLRDRVDILLQERFDLPIYRHLTDINTRRFNVRLCSAWLLTLAASEDYYTKKLVLLTLINNLIQICLLSNKMIGTLQTLTYKSVDQLLSMAMSLILCKVPDTLNLSWSDIIQREDNKYTVLYGKKDDDPGSWSVDKFLNSFLTNEFKNYEDSLYENKGALIAENGNIKIMPIHKSPYEKTMLKNTLVGNSLIPSWNLNVYSDKKSQIKDSKKDDVEAIEECINSVVLEQQKCKATTKERFLKEYVNGDSVPIEIVEIGEKNMVVKTIDPEYKPITSKLVFENTLQLFKDNYPYDLWVKALPVGTRINAKYNEKSKCFSITDQFVDYIRDFVNIGDEKKCKYYRDILADCGFYEFVSNDGYIFFLPLSDVQYDQIDDDGYIIAQVYEHNSEKNRKGCIKATFVSNDDSPVEFEAEEALQSLVDDFIYYIGEINISQEREVTLLDECFIKEICYTLNVMQSRESNPNKRYRLLCVVKLLSEMAQFEKESLYVSYLSKYIKTLILFAQSDKDENKYITSIKVPEGLESNEIISSGTEILKVLSMFSKEPDNEINQALADYIDSDNKLISKTASLVQSYNHLKDLLDTRTLRGIKRQILEGLSVIIDGDSNLDLSNKQVVNFGEEDDTKEFKHSFLFAPNSAKEQRQEYTVCKAICGMMNNRGGVVYLGVGEDQDGLGRPVGLDLDLEELSRRDHVRNSLDDYVVYINRKGEEWFGETAWHYVRITQDREYNIIKINVDPYPYDVVYLTDGKTYLRKNNSTDEIKEESTIEDIRRRRQEALRKVDDKLINLQDAIRKGLKVRLLGYQSSNSEKTSNRIVEPFHIEDNEYVICYEPAVSKVKMFRISRIDKVVVSEEKCTNRGQHKMPFIDIFHMADDSTSKKNRIRIKLNLKLRAKNALCEMYPKAAQCLLAIDNETWQFETEVTSMKPIMHFYLNYAESTEIIDAPGLKEELQNYINCYILKS